MDTFFLIGVILALAGNTLIATALTLQKYTHNQERKTGTPAASSPLFWLSIGGMIGGEVGNFAAFGFASPTVVSPLGAIAVIVNGLLAAVLLRERLRVRNVIGMVLTIGGSVVVVLNAPPTVDELSVDTFVSLLAAPTSLAYLALLALTVSLLYLAEPTYGRKYLLVNLMLCSTLGSVTVLCSSATAKFIGLLVSGDYSLLTSPIVYVVPPTMGATAVLQLKFLNQAMSHFPSSQVVPTYYVTFTICSISGGGVVLQDFWRFTPAGALGFCAGCALCFGGVGLVTWGDAEKPVDKLRRSIKTVLHLSGFLGTVQETASSVSRQIDDSLDKSILGETEQTPPSPALISGPGFGFAQSTRRDLIASQRQGGGSGTLLM